MTSLTLYLLGIIGVIMLLSAMPLTRPLVAPLGMMATYLFKVIVENGASWLIWAVKRIYADHAVLLRHLTSSADEIDKSINLRF